MELPKGVLRVQVSDLPNRPVYCASILCVYNAGHPGRMCDMPRINKGNSDALCHTESNKSLLKRINELTPNEQGKGLATTDSDKGE